MSAAANPLPQPRPEPRPVPPIPEEPRRGGGKWLFLLAFLSAGAGAGWWYLKQPATLPDTGGPGGPGTLQTFKTAAIQRGDLEVRARITGVTTARNFSNISAPRLRGPGDRAMTILSVTGAGKMVKKGDVVCEIDPQDLKNRIDDEQDTLRNAENAIKKKIVEQELDMENLTQSLRVAKANLEKAQLDMKTTPVRTEVDKELLQLAIDEAKAAYDESQKEIESKKLSHKADLRNVEISYQIQKIRVDNAVGDLAKFTIRASMDGMVVMQSQFKPGGEQTQIQAGDQVAPGQPFMKVVDPNSMQVEATVNQTESNLFRISQPATVALDAFPGTRYPGRVYALGALAASSGRQQFYNRSLPIRIQVLKPDSKMIPDLSASADVMLGKAEQVLLAPTAAVHHEGGKDYVYLKTATGFEKRPVETGPNSGTLIALMNGVKEGDEIRVGN